MNFNTNQQYQKTLEVLQADRVEAERQQQKKKEKLENDSKQKIEEIVKLTAAKEANEQNRILPEEIKDTKTNLEEQKKAFDAKSNALRKKLEANAEKEKERDKEREELLKKRNKN